jgi:hypothetical protein
MDDQFIRCPTCRYRFANTQSLDAHRTHGRCVNPRSLGQSEVYGVYYIKGTARQVTAWAEATTGRDPDLEPGQSL